MKFLNFFIIKTYINILILFKLFIKLFFIFYLIKPHWGLGIGDWGLGIGVLGVGAKTQNPNPKPQNPKK